MNVLVDHTRIDARKVTPDDIRTISGWHVERDGEIGRGCRAIVAGERSLAFGFVRRWQSLTEGKTRLRARAFMTAEAADEWLRTGGLPPG
jgi:hypothetical protein